MIFSKPYKIYQVDLAIDWLPRDIDPTVGHYFVFWWCSIPLGELFIPPDTNLAATDVLKKFSEAIRPAMAFYFSKVKKEMPLGSGGLDKKAIKDLCQDLFETDIKEPFPDTCPISVIICTRDRPEHLKNCLSAIQELKCKPFEVMVVDNASIDDKTKQVVSDFKDVTYIRENRPGLDIARNTGAKNASCSIIAFTDDDTRPDSNWAYEVFRTFGDTKVSAMTGLVMAAELQTEAQLIFEKHWPFNRGYCDKRFDQDFFQQTLKNGPTVWEIGAGANMAFRKEILEKVGYFDERLDVGAAGCSGDSELWYRILANGYMIDYNPRAVVHHFHRESMHGLRKQLYAYMRGFTVAIIIQYNRFGHKGNLRHLFINTPMYYAQLLVRGFPRYRFRYRTLLAEIRGIVSGLFYYWKHRHTDAKIFDRR